jgi:hypothetical protein
MELIRVCSSRDWTRIGGSGIKSGSCGQLDGAAYLRFRPARRCQKFYAGVIIKANVAVVKIENIDNKED